MKKPGDRKEPSLLQPLVPRPLADRLRPRRLEEVVGQDHLLRPDGPIGRMVASGRLTSMILWGPPGCGKTTIARLLALRTTWSSCRCQRYFPALPICARCSSRRAHRARPVAARFIDEIHRFNRAQQDGFLPYVEDGTVMLVGATTENPLFELNPPLLALPRAGAEPAR
jgi:putative ATPase